MPGLFDLFDGLEKYAKPLKALGKVLELAKGVSKEKPVPVEVRFDVGEKKVLLKGTLEVWEGKHDKTPPVVTPAPPVV